MKKSRKAEKKGRNHGKREQSKLSKIISRCNAYSKRVGDRRVRASHREKSFLAMQLMFNSFSSNEIKINFSSISDNILFKDFIYLSASKNRKVSDIFYPFVRGMNIHQDILWCSLIINKHIDAINKCIKIEKNIQRDILALSFDSARENLLHLESITGFSIWIESIKSGIDVIDDSKEDVDLSNINSENNLLSAILKRACGYYQDEDIFLTAIKTDRRILDRYKDNESSKILSHYAMPIGSIDDIDYDVIFTATKYTSIYDIYKLLVKYLAKNTGISQIKKQAECIGMDILGLLSPVINSPVMLNTAILRNACEMECGESSFEKVKIYDLYINERFSEVVDIINSHDIEDIDFDLFEIAVRSNIRSGNLNLPGMFKKISECMSDLILKNSRYSDSYQKLSFLAYTFRALDWFSQLGIFIERESEFISASKAEYLDMIFSVHISGNSTKKISLFGDGYAEFLLKNLHSPSAGVIYGIAKNESLHKVNLNTAPLSLTLLKIRELISAGRPKEVLENLYIIVEKNRDPVLTIEAKRLLMDCLLLLNKHSEALAIFVSESLNSLHNASIYDIDAVISECIKSFKNSSSIDFPIALSLFARLKSSEYESELKYSIEVFLTKNYYKNPQDILKDRKKYEQSRLHYFLKWVCTQENMSLLFCLPSPEDIEKCRVSICNYLIKNGDTSDYLTKELMAISKKNVEILAAQNVDKSRIFVDTSSFYGRDSDQYRILFDRYLQYSYSDYSDSEDEIHFQKIISDIKGDEELSVYDFASVLSSIHFPDIRLNKKNATFLSLSQLFREEFAYGNKGLNNHLSTRIRHGVLPTTLRKPFSDEGLFANKESSDFDVRFNLDSGCDTADMDALSISLIGFTEKIEAHIKKINDCWLQIVTLDSSVSLINNLEKNNFAQFNFSVSAIESFYVQQGLPISPVYDDLVRVMVNWLWGKTNFNLSKIRELLRSESEPFLIESLDELKSEISLKITNQQLRSEVSNAISRAKSKISGHIDLVLSWFTRDDHLNYVEPIALSTAIEIAGKSLSMKVNINSLAECKISSRSISYFVDIFHILFENAISKSGIDRSKLSVNVTIKNNNGNIDLSVSNNCGDGVVENLDLDFYRECYGYEDLIRDSIQKEGGTGLFKIWKILEKDLGIKHRMNLTTSKNVFSIEFSIPPSKDFAFS